MHLTFGATVRRLRTEKGLGLREFAAKIGLSPTYVSKIERDEFDPPAEDGIRAMARVLGQDPEEFLALAQRIPEDLSTILKERQKEMAVLLRTANRMSNDDLKNLIEKLERQQKKQA